MYRKPSKKKELLTRTFTYSLMTIGVLITVSIVVLAVSGYRFDADKGQVEQGALVQFASTPSNAVIEIDGSALSTKTSAKAAVFPGVHEFVMWREGYETWRKTLDVKAGSLVWLNYALLVPKELPTYSVAKYPTIHASLASPTQRAILVQEDSSKPDFSLVDISGDTVKSSPIVIPAEIYSEADTPDVEHSFTAESWDEDGRYVLVTHTYASTKELLVLDTRAPAETKNVTTLLNIALDHAQFSGTSGNILYALSEGTIRKLDISAGTISRALVTNVKSFKLYDTNALSYVSLPDTQTQHQTVGIYREGDTSAHVLRTVQDKDETLAIAANRYFGQDYVAITQGKDVSISTGSFSALTNKTDTLKTIASYTLPEVATDVEFNEPKSHIFIRAGSSYSSYSIELNTHSTSTLDVGSAPSLSWLDEMYLWSDTGGSLVIRELDGANEHVIGSVSSGQAATLSRNGKYLYSFNKIADSEEYELQRVRMILSS